MEEEEGFDLGGGMGDAVGGGGRRDTGYEACGEDLASVGSVEFLEVGCKGHFFLLAFCPGVKRGCCSFLFVVGFFPLLCFFSVSSRILFLRFV